MVRRDEWAPSMCTSGLIPAQFAVLLERAPAPVPHDRTIVASLHTDAASVFVAWQRARGSSGTLASSSVHFLLLRDDLRPSCLHLESPLAAFCRCRILSEALQCSARGLRPALLCAFTTALPPGPERPPCYLVRRSRGVWACLWVPGQTSDLCSLGGNSWFGLGRGRACMLIRATFAACVAM